MTRADLLGSRNHNRTMLRSSHKDGAGTPWSADGNGDGGIGRGIRHCVGRPASALPSTMPPVAHELPHSPPTYPEQ